MSSDGGKLEWIFAISIPNGLIEFNATISPSAEGRFTMPTRAGWGLNASRARICSTRKALFLEATTTHSTRAPKVNRMVLVRSKLSLVYFYMIIRITLIRFVNHVHYWRDVIHPRRWRSKYHKIRPRASFNDVMQWKFSSHREKWRSETFAFRYK